MLRAKPSTFHVRERYCDVGKLVEEEEPIAEVASASTTRAELSEQGSLNPWMKRELD